VTAVSGSGPAYIFFVVESMIEAGVHLGCGPAATSARTDGSDAVAGHRRHEQLIHPPLSQLDEIGRLRGIEAAPPGGHNELMKERGAEAEKALDRLRQRKAEFSRGATVAGRADGCLFQMVPGCLGSTCVEVLQQSGSENLPTLTEQQTLPVIEGEHPGELRRDIAACLAVGTRDPCRRQPGSADRGPPRPIRRQQALERIAREPSMSAGGGEHPQTAGVAPAAECRWGHAQQSARLGQTDPVSLGWFGGGQNLLKSTRRLATHSL